MILDKETIKYRRALEQIRIAVNISFSMHPDDRRHILYLIDTALRGDNG